MENTPNEIQWNIIKFMRHPIAEVFKDASVGISYLDDDHYCIHGFSFAFNWFNEALYEKQEMIEKMNIDERMKNRLKIKIKRDWDLYIER